MPRPVKKRRVALPENIGKIRQHLTDNYSIFPDDLNDLKNGHMLLLTIANDRSIGKTLKVVAEKSSMQITPAQLRSLLNGQRSFRVVSMMPPWRSIQACAASHIRCFILSKKTNSQILRNPSQDIQIIQRNLNLIILIRIQSQDLQI